MDFIYILKLVKRLIPEEGWTPVDSAVVEEHFKRLILLKENGKLLLAGKTTGQDENTFGVVIFQAENNEEANDIMNSDPAILKGIMTGKLWEYSTAVFNREYEKD